jgi:hypothetical protein
MNYIIVRSRARDTVKLVDGFQVNGIDGWTPQMRQRVRLPRLNKTVVMDRPAMPGFLFVAEQDLELSISLGERREIPPHNPFVFNGAVARVEGVAVAHLRLIDRSQLAVKPMPALGDRVVILGGPLQGQRGEVVGLVAPYLVIRLQKTTLDIKIDPCMVGPLNI